MHDKVSTLQLVLIGGVLITIVALCVRLAENSATKQTMAIQSQIEAHKQAAERALATADSLQAIIDIRELQIKTIYETLDHIPDYVRGMSAAERDSLRAIINPPY